MESLETERLILRPRVLSDFDACLAMDREPEMLRHVPTPWSNAQEHRRFLRQRLEERPPSGLGYWSILAKDKPTAFLGWVMLYPYDLHGAEVEIGWRLRRAAWGLGYATEAAAPILAHGFEAAGLSQVVADIVPANRASIRVARKIGLTFAGEVSDKNLTLHRYSTTREAFAARSEG